MNKRDQLNAKTKIHFTKKNKQKIYFQVEKMKNLKFVKYKFPMN